MSPQSEIGDDFVKSSSSGESQQHQQEEEASPKLRIVRNSMHAPTQCTFDEMTAGSMRTFNIEGQPSCSEAAALNPDEERKHKLQKKLKYQQAQTKRGGPGLTLTQNQCLENDASAASPFLAECARSVDVSANVDADANVGEQSTQDLPRRTHRLRTRSTKLREREESVTGSSRDQWQNAWDEDSASTSDDDDEEGGNLNGVQLQRMRLNSDLSKQVDDELTRGEDAVKWESGREIVDVEYSKPHLEMFSQLRVLGKGSFGKVSSNAVCMYVCIACACTYTLYSTVYFVVLCIHPWSYCTNSCISAFIQP